MTMALCLNCGEIKFGALCECDKCKAGSTGDMDLDICFSDHHYAVETLRELGNVVKEIHTHSGDQRLCFVAFMQYVSENHPSILRVNPGPEDKARATEILSRCSMPAVTLRSSPSNEYRKDEHTQQ